MSLPVAVYDVYYSQMEFLENRSDLAAVTANPFSKSLRRILLSTCALYDYKTKEHVGEFTTSYTEIESLNGTLINILANSLINIVDKIIIPNKTTGFIYTNESSYDKVIAAIPTKIWTQNSNGKRVLIKTNPVILDVTQVIRLIIEEYAEDF